jgi:hypothetical protein
LSWIAPYALITAGNSNWLTRDVNTKQKGRARWRRKLFLQPSDPAVLLPMTETTAKSI